MCFGVFLKAGPGNLSENNKRSRDVTVHSEDVVHGFLRPSFEKHGLLVEERFWRWLFTEYRKELGLFRTQTPGMFSVGTIGKSSARGFQDEFW